MTTEPKSDVMTLVYERARAADARIILAETDDARITEAAGIIAREKLVRELIMLDAGYWERLPQEQKDLIVRIVQQARAKDALTTEQASALVAADTKYLAAAMVKADLAEGYVAGNLCATADTIRPALKIIGTRDGFASSFFLMLLRGVPLLFADSGFNIAPTPEQLARIGSDTARTAAMLGLSPRVAFLSFATYDSASHPLVDAVKEAVTLARKSTPDVAIDGPLQFDAAFDASVAARKAPASAVAGQANVFIFPDLNSGNIAYKIAERLGGCQAIGPLMQGLNAPVNDLSRGCSAQDIVDVVAFTAMQSIRL